MGLPLLAKNAGGSNPTPSSSSKGSKSLPLTPSNPATVNEVKEKQKKAVVTVTPDISRGAVSPSLAAKQEAASADLTQVVPATRIHSDVSSTVAKNSRTASTGSKSSVAKTESRLNQPRAAERLARVTAYWAGEGDYYTGRCISATGIRLHDGHCAVDPNIIPYGSVVEIAGVGKFLAVDTGSAVISRTAAREGGHTSAERSAIVVDVFFEDRSEGERFAASAAKYVAISWWTPTSMGVEAKAARSLFAEEDWTKIQSKQL